MRDPRTTCNVYAMDTTKRTRWGYDPEDRCPGHETTDGAIGSETYCDGRCQR